MAKKITSGKEVFNKTLIGLDKVADCVGSTLGAKGRNVFLMDNLLPEIINDGAKIANKIVLKDQQEDAGAWIIRNISSQQLDDVGDGTTTVAVLTQAIIHECLKRPENPMEIRESLKEAGDKILKLLIKQSNPIKREDIEKVALVSSEDKTLAKLITEIINKLGDKAVINVEDSKTFATEYEIVDGYEANVGFMSLHFINDKKSNKAVYDNIPVLVSEKKISNIQDIQPIFELFKKESINQCVIVCEDIDDSMLGLLVMNKNMGIFNSLVIRATGPLLQDIAGTVGAKPISDSSGITFRNFVSASLGTARKVVCDANKTIFIGDGISSKEYADKLDAQAETEPNMYTQKNMKQRVAKLRGGIAVLKIGAPTDTERTYLKEKAEDAVKATQAALEEGIIKGGGMALWKIAQELKPKTIGEEILKRAIISPLRKIIENSGKDYTDILMNMPKIYGYDAKNDCYVDMITAGIIDPVKVTRCALENAVSAASQFITINNLITDVAEKSK
jgi:chaperonin GroEL